MLIKVLIIEDITPIRDNIAELLALKGYQVKAAACGEEGVSVAKEWHPNLILCDIMMPTLDGYQVLEAIRTCPAIAHIPFIFLTAKTDMVDLRRGMSLGADDYLTKPFLAADLLKAIESRLKRSQQQGLLESDSSLYLKTIRGRDPKGYMQLQTDDCYYFSVQDRDYFAEHPLGTFQISQTIEKLAVELDPKQFFRINRHLIIHRKILQKYAYWDKGKYCLYLSCEGNIREAILPKARFTAFKEWLSS
ncbi:response regulator [Spirosoma sp. KNUC1025]|uniref:response regulator n=1 Tax=Spirosoma sp. KNUC1025 TaxID=2894082 RepID=UPI00386C4640|nr:response regulator [Spirosoma sp. KNUC1025]